MGTLYLVRHGQASYGAADYDQLSELGTRQCLRLGEYFRSRSVHFDAVLRGSLRRHEQSLASLLQGYGPAPEASVWPAMNEYDSAAVIRAVQPDLGTAEERTADRRAHFRLLREALEAWIDARSAPAGMPSYAEFRAGVIGVLDQVRQQQHAKVLLMSSGGPIGAAVAYVLGAPQRVAIDLNLRLRNTAITEFVFNAKGHILHSFNHLPHLDEPDLAPWVTFA